MASDITLFLFTFFSTLVVSDCDFYKKEPHLEDLVNGLQEKTWSGDQKQCFETTMQMIENTRNFTLWATWTRDALQVKPVGLLYGSQYHLGSFDQCLEPPWSLEAYPELRTQYCLAEVHIEGKKMKKGLWGFDPYASANKYLHTRTIYNRAFNSVSWGICVPASCNTESVRNILETLLSRSHLAAVTSDLRIRIESACQVAGKLQKYSLGFYMFIIFALSLIILTLVSSYIYDPNNPTSDYKKEGETKSMGVHFLEIAKCFSLQENYKKLVKVEVGEIVVLNGIRVLTSVIVVLIHLPLLTTVTHIMFNGNGFEKMLTTQFSWIQHLDLPVDTFFVMSGLLLIKSLMPKLGSKLENPLKQLFKRYLRLAPICAVIIFYISAVFWHTGSGPIWPLLALKEVKSCQNNWWLNLLMANNYFHQNEQCFIISWSVTSDFHFTIMGTMLFHLYNRHRTLGGCVFIALFLAALVLPGTQNYANGYPHLILAYIEGLKDLRNNEAFNALYIPSHMRMASYFIGMMLGYIISIFKPSEYKKVIPQSWSVAGTSLAVCLLASVLHFGTRDHSLLGAALCSSLNRPVWAIGVAMLIICCLYGTVPIVNSFLCWDVFRPLSRLTYGVYLFHSLIYLRGMFSARTPYHMDFGKMLTEGVGVLAVSFMISLVLWMLVETPVINLYTLFTKPSSFSKVTTTNGFEIQGQAKEPAVHNKVD